MPSASLSSPPPEGHLPHREGSPPPAKRGALAFTLKLLPNKGGIPLLGRIAQQARRIAARSVRIKSSRYVGLLFLKRIARLLAGGPKAGSLAIARDEE